MESRNCVKCGKVFPYFGTPICEACKIEEEKIFEMVKSYIAENPENDLKTVSEDTGVGSRKILKYIKEGRLIISKGLSKEVRCEHCGKPISSGRFCDRCVLKLQNVANDLHTTKAVAKMHTR